MSGRDKRAPASPEEEREQLRQLTRELHEAAKNARDAARELRAARQETEAASRSAADRAAAEAAGQLERRLEAERHSLEDFRRTLLADLQAAHALIAGFKTGEEFGNWIVRQVTKELYEYAMKDDDRSLPLPANRGQVLVATEESLREFVAAGGDPGIVIDAR